MDIKNSYILFGGQKGFFETPYPDDSVDFKTIRENMIHEPVKILQSELKFRHPKSLFGKGGFAEHIITGIAPDTTAGTGSILSISGEGSNKYGL